MSKLEKVGKSAIIYDVAKGIYFGKKRGDKTQFEQAVKKAKDNNISEAEGSNRCWIKTEF